MSFIINPYRFGQAYDADYQAVLVYATGQGWTLPSLTNQAHQNAYVIELKAIGAWTLIDILYIFWSDIDGTGGGDSNFACINVKSPGNFTCLKVSSPTYDDGAGFTGNGSSSYLNTQFNPATNGVNYTLNNAGVFHYVKTDIAANGNFDYGQRVSANGARANTRNGSDDASFSLNSAFNNNPSANSLGFWLNTRNGSLAGNNDLFKDGSLVDPTGAGSASVASSNLFICAGSSSGVAEFFGSRTISVLGLGGDMLSIQSDLYTAWTNYIT